MRENTKSKVIYIAPSLSSFVKTDIAILSANHKVLVNTYRWNKTLLTPLYLIHQLFFLLWHIFSTNTIIVSFGGYWALFPAILGKLTRRPVYIILNGTDCASFPQLNYGSLRKPVLRFVCKISYKLAKGLLPVSSSLVLTKNTYFSNNNCLQGFQHFFPDLTTPYEILPNGFDSNFWKPEPGTVKDPNSFLTVFSPGQYVLKGGDLIVQVSKKFPACQFYIAGIEKPEDLPNTGDNIHFLGKLSAQDLKSYYNKCQFYFQLSIFEGFGCALCEAMLCECIPIGSEVNIIPDIIGDTGLILHKRDNAALNARINDALNLQNKELTGKNARKRIMDNYDIEKRITGLIKLVKEKQ